MPRILITGANGFVGTHAVAEFRAHGYDVMEGLGPSSTPDNHHQITFDLTNYEKIRSAVDHIQPDFCLHLAGQAHIPFCQNDPVTATDLNVTGTVRLLEAFRRHRSNGRILVVTSGEVYGNVPSGKLVDETHALTPSTLYGISKQAADEAALAFHRQLGLDVMTARPWNHIGPGQHPRFVSSAFAHQLVKLKGQPDPVMRVGNLDSTRDFTDVRDIVRGYRHILERGRSGEAYNLASSRLRPIRQILEVLTEITQTYPHIEIVPEFFRPTDSSPLLATEKIRTECKWSPKIPLRTTLEDLVNSIETR